jgi:hypothetical protein
MLLGSIGWFIALILRTPFIFLIKNKYGLSKQVILIPLLSGPAEESVRLLLIILFSITFSKAYSLGFGWTTIEVFYALIQTLALSSLNKRTDNKALKAKELVKQIGMENILEANPLWGVIERISVSAIHISFSLLLTLNPLYVIIIMPGHSLINEIILKLTKKSIATLEVVIFGLGAILFTIAVILGLR